MQTDCKILEGGAMTTDTRLGMVEGRVEEHAAAIEDLTCRRRSRYARRSDNRLGQP